MAMDIKISFHDMDHSNPLEAHARGKLHKLEEMVSVHENMHPFFVELWLHGKKLHANHSAELHLKTPLFDLVTHDNGPDLYVLTDNVIDKMVKLIKKERGKLREKTQKQDNEKKKFIDGEDKYTLGD